MSKSNDLSKRNQQTPDVVNTEPEKSPKLFKILMWFVKIAYWIWRWLKLFEDGEG